MRAVWRLGSARCVPAARGLFFALVIALAIPAFAAEPFITLASTTSTENSGLLRAILPLFQKKTGVVVRVVVQGTGQALESGERGDVDLVLVHNRQAEEAFVKAGFGVARYPVMHNDFVIVGPAADPVKLRGCRDAIAALMAISARGAPFVSRGDESGTHKKESELWAAAGRKPKGAWYRSTGSGMGATLNIASELMAYTLTDRGTWLAFKNKGQLELLVEGDGRLHNPYGIVLIDPRRHPHVKVAAAKAFINWLTGPEGQKAIADFEVSGQQLFVPHWPPEGAASRPAKQRAASKPVRR